MEDCYTITAVERMTGVPQELIRTWERRYGVVRPSRTTTNRRRYSRRDIEKLRLIRAAIEAGNSISAVAELDLEALRRMTSASSSVGIAPKEPQASAGDTVARCLEAAREMDAPSLARLLPQAATDLGPARFASEVAAPLLSGLGDAWRAGQLHPAQEHLATEMVRAELARMIAANQPDGDAPLAVVATMRGHAHDLGAMLAAVMAAVAGWAVRFLGSSLPAEEIAWATRASGARAILLSIVYPPDDTRVSTELAEMRRILGPDLPIAVGGRAASAYAATLETNRIVLCPELEGLRDFLDGVRGSAVMLAWTRGSAHADA